MQRSKSSTVLVTVALVALTVLGAAPPAGGADAFVPLPLGASRGIDSRTFGAASPVEQRIGIDTATTRIRVSAALSYAEPADYFTCSLAGPDGGVLSRDYWIVEQFDEYTRLELDSTDRLTEAPGSVYAVRCESGSFLGFATRQRTWYLTLQDGDESELELVADPATLVEATSSLDYSPGPTVTAVEPGAQVRITGAPGTWGEPGVSGGSRVTLTPSTGGETMTPDGAVTISADGSAIDFDVPAPLAGDPAVVVDVLTQSRQDRDGSAPYVRTDTRWRGTVAVGAAPVAAPSTTTLTLRSHYGLSFVAPRATATVRATGTSVPVGWVDFAVDGNYQLSAALTSASNGAATATLPPLPKGTHTITATFRSTDGAVAPSASKPWTLRILR